MRFRLTVSLDHGCWSTLIVVYEQINSLLPSEYARILHNALWNNIERADTEHWQLCLQAVQIGSPPRWGGYESRIVWTPELQRFQFPEVEFINDVMDGPQIFPDLHLFDWRCLLKKDFT